MSEGAPWHAPGSYRPEIDGLRAVAVIPVVLYHAHMPGVSGGFVGVDVFFVISGFLITGILAGDVAAGRFSLLTFYERRVRRIFPALFAMLAVSCLLALWLLLPNELKDFASSLSSAALFVSNLHFMGETGYFVGAPGTKPLLHTWSLSVEEQFYIVFPVYLYLMSRWAPRWLLPVTLAVLALSLVFCVLMTHPQDDEAFYFTPTRVWELLAGSVLALAPRRTPLPGPLAQMLGLAGLALIAAAVFGFDARTPFPGIAAAVPVAGTVLVLYATAANRTQAGALLSLGPLRFFGLISYSLYLWHWPLLVFYGFWRIAPPAAWEIAMVVLASVAVATLSWRYVERPFRTRRLLGQRPRLLASGVAAMAAAVLFAQVGGLPGRFPPELLTLAEIRRDEPRFADCDTLPGGRPCLIGEGGADQARFVMWGDSHAAGLMPAFEEAARQVGATGIFMGRGGCVPFVGVDQFRWGVQGCAENNDRILEVIAARPEIGTVLLVGRWAFYATGLRYLREAGHPAFILDDETGRPSFAENERVFERGLTRTLAALAALGRRVVIVSQAPESEFELAQAMARARWLGHDLDFAPGRADFEARQAIMTRLFAAAEARGDATVLDLGAVLCPDVRCPVVRDGTPLYRDSNHVTATYAKELAGVFEPVLATTRNP